MFSFLFSFLILTAVVSGGVLFFLKKVLHNDTESAINRLNRAYQELLKRQEELNQKIQEAEKEYATKKDEAEKIKDKMTSDAVEEARQKKDAILKTAKEEADDMVGKAHASTEKFYHEIEKKVSEKTIDFSAGLVSQAFTEKMAAALHHEMVRAFIEKGKDLDLGAVGAHIDSYVIKSTFPLTKDEKDQLTSVIAARLSRQLKVEEMADKGLIAGLLLQFGTLILDSSLHNSLKEAAYQSKRKLEGGV